jgi:hypothetical protein
MFLMNLMKDWFGVASFNVMFYESREGKLDEFSYLETLKTIQRRLHGVLFS